MPFTPFHFGIAALIKAFVRNHFSFYTFVVSQVLIDMETLYNILMENSRLHTFFHSFLGSTLVAFITIPVALYSLKVFSYVLPVPRPTRKVVAVSALIGAWSHVVLDSLMHLDIEPFFPVSRLNPFLGMVTLDMLHIGCLAALIIGVLIYGLRSRDA